MKKICVVTGTRAEYGILKHLISSLSSNSKFQLQLVVTGTHLTAEFGLTVEAIEADGHHIDKRIDILLSSGTAVSVVKSMGLANIGMADAFSELDPDLLVLVGDRYEAMSAATTAMVLKIPIAHIHGGERTEGAIDEAIRHSITKMSHIHFVTAEDNRRRIMQLGEDPKRVFTVGAPGLDNIRRLNLRTKQELEEEWGISIQDLMFIVTYHPVTLEEQPPEIAVSELLAALDNFPEATLIITYPNADPNSRGIYDVLSQFAEDRDNVFLSRSLGSLNYLSTLKLANAVIGNSSSGLIEAPFLKTPTVNIGIRQRGRLSGNTVINCADNEAEITQSIHSAIELKKELANKEPSDIYGDGNASEKIVSILEDIDLTGILLKQFNDIEL